MRSLIGTKSRSDAGLAKIDVHIPAGFKQQSVSIAVHSAT